MTNRFIPRSIRPGVTGGPLALLVVLAFAAPQTVYAQDTKTDTPAVKADDAPVLWSITYKKGDTRHFRISANLTGDSGNGPFTLVYKGERKSRVKEAKPDGGATIESTTLSDTILYNDTVVSDNSKDHPVTTLQVDKTGQVLDQISKEEIKGNEPLAKLAVLLGLRPLPPKAVKIGENWTTEYNNKIFGKQKIFITYTLLSRETTFGKATYKVKATGELPINEDPKDFAKLDAVLFIEPLQADVLQANFKVENFGMPIPTGGAIKVHLIANVEQVVPGVNDKVETKK